MRLVDTTKTELRDHCRKISRILGLTQGSIEIHCHKGEPMQMHVHDGPEELGDGLNIMKHDKSIKFENEK